MSCFIPIINRRNRDWGTKFTGVNKERAHSVAERSKRSDDRHKIFSLVRAEGAVYVLESDDGRRLCLPRRGAA